jgi:hypothetical protein
MRRLLSLLVILAAAVAACAGSASAQTTNCVGTLFAGTYVNVDVPANMSCTLGSGGNVTVTGNVTVESGAMLLLGRSSLQSFAVNGSLIGVNASTIALAPGNITRVNILGSVHLTGTTRGVGLIKVSITGTLSILDSTWVVEVAGNTVGGSVLVQDNTSSGSFISIEDNTIGGSLVCTGNTPAPSLEGESPNTVGRNKVGQCEGL